MIKVLNLTTHINSGGITIYILRLCKELRKHAFQYDIASSGGDYSRHFRDYGANTLKIDIKTKNIFHPKIFAALPKLIRYVKRENVQLIHAHTRVAQVLAYWLQKFTGVPVVTTCHGFYKMNLGRKLLPAWGNACIAISRPVGERLKQQYDLSDGQVRVIHNAVDVAEWENVNSSAQKHVSRKQFGLKEDDQVIGIVARLEKVKGQGILLEAFRELRKKHSRAKLLIAGDGKDMARLRDLTKEWSLQDSVIFTGHLDDVRTAFNVIDFFAFPATWEEPFGFALIEAMACGIPVIATDTWALADIVREADAARLISVQDSQALYRSLDEWLSEPGLAAKMADNAKRLVQQRFSIEAMASDISKLYNELLTHPEARL